jgi:hypothetical protein
MGSSRATRSKRTAASSADPANEADETLDITRLSRDEQVHWAFEILFGQGALEKSEAVRRVTAALTDLGLVGTDAEPEHTAEAEDDPAAETATEAATEAEGKPSEGAADPARVRVVIERALDAGIKQGRFDRPKRGYVRAIRPDPKDYSLDDWSLILVSALDREPTARDAALRFAAYWGATNMGLTFSRLREGGAILNGLDAAMRAGIERGTILDAGADCIRKA